MGRRRVCFATFELAPFTGGGIGTWLANTLDEYKSGPVDFEVLLCAGVPPSPAAFAKVYPGVALHALDLENPRPEYLAGHSLTRADVGSYAQWRSYLVMCALEHLERTKGRFDVIEFVDWCGMGYFSINAKRLGRSFQDTVLSVRIHATESVLRDHEPRGWSADNLIIADLERQALENADVTVAHLDPVADAFEAHFGFGKEWRSGFRVELPPVRIHQHARAIEPAKASTPILLTSKIQSIKRPEIFARAASRFAVEHPEFNGDIRFLAFDVEGDLRSRCEAAFPPALTERVIFGGPKDSAEREAIIRDGVVVFPGMFETFCFAAYEASLAGATVILNGCNPAFGDKTPWIDGVNCLKFDGTSQGLFDCLERLFAAKTPDLVPVKFEPEPRPYWETVAPSRARSKSRASLSMVVPHRYEGGLLYNTVEGLLSSVPEGAEIIVASQGAGEASTDLVLDAIQTVADEAPERVRLIRREGRCGLGELLQQGLAASSGDIIAIVPAGFEALPDFLSHAVAALEANPAYDIVLPSIRVVPEHDPFGTAQHWLPIGASVHHGLFANRMSPGVLVARRSVFERFPPDETLTAEWMWDVALRAAFAGCRFIVMDEPGVQAIARVLFDQYPHAESQRRETIETIRRRLAVTGTGVRMRLSYLGDGEVMAASGPLAQVSTSYHGEDWRGRALAAEDQLRALSEATSVRFALRAAHGLNKAMPSGMKRVLSTALRKR